MSKNEAKRVFTPEEIESLERMQLELSRSFDKALKQRDILEPDKAKNWNNYHAYVNSLTAIGACATGYTAVTETLSKAKVSPN